MADIQKLDPNKKEINQDFRDLDVESLGEEHINLVFTLGRENFGVDVNLVREIVRVPSFITRVPNAPGYDCSRFRYAHENWNARLSVD